MERSGASSDRVARALVALGLLTALATSACGGSEFSEGSADASGGGGSSGASSGGMGGSATGGTAGGGTGGTATGGASGSGAAGGTGGGPTGGSGGGPTGGTGGGPTGGTGGGPPLTACPASRPEQGTACEGDFRCSYGSDPRPGCRDQLECDQGALTGTIAGCPPIEACSFPPIVGQPCSADGEICLMGSSNVLCLCGCVGACSSGPEWNCSGPPGGPCPTFLPNEGQPCSDTSRHCDYGSCGTGNKMGADCKETGWIWVIQACTG